MTHIPDLSPHTSSGPSLRVLVKPGQAIPAGAPRVAADGGPYTLRGNTANFRVSYEDALGASGPVLADAVLATCEADYASLRTWFGGLTPGGLPFTVFVVTGTFGAYHASCAATELHLAAFDGTNADLVRMLMVAEADEVMMAAQNVGWDCGASHGEGLSRVLSTEIYPAQLNGFATAASWLELEQARLGDHHRTDRSELRVHRLRHAVSQLPAPPARLQPDRNRGSRRSQPGAGLHPPQRQGRRLHSLQHAAAATFPGWPAEWIDQRQSLSHRTLTGRS
jgi:hypothetical protein